MNKRVLLILILLMSVLGIAKAQDKLLVFGLRAGTNLSAQSANFDEIFPAVSESDMLWKSGFYLGGVVDIRLGDKFAIQPGLYWKYHAFNYFIATQSAEGNSMGYSSGAVKFSTIQVPVLFSYKLALSSVECRFDLGPYMAYGISGSQGIDSSSMYIGDDGLTSTKSYKYSADFYGDSDKYLVASKNVDWGLKMGIGITLFSDYYLGAHYNLGLMNLGKYFSDYKSIPKVRSNSVDFSLGYNF